MTIIEIILFTGTLWLIVIIFELAQDRKWGPTLLQGIVTRLFSSFLPSVVIHLSLFCTFYGALSYLLVQMSPLFKFELTLFFLIGGITCVVPLIQAIRIRTDETWLLRRWITKDMRETEHLEVYLETLLRKIQNNKEQESSRRMLIVLREISIKGDSTGALVRKALENYNLL